MKSSINLLITAGGTSEPIDNVRRIANTGTGRLGSLIADAFSGIEGIDHIFYICARDSVHPTSEKVTCVEIQSVADLQKAVTELTGQYPIHGVIHSMAVSDYTVRSVSTVEDLASFLTRQGSMSMNPQEATQKLSSINSQNVSQGSPCSEDLQQAIEAGMDATDIRTGAGKLSSQMKSPLLLLEPTPKILPLFRDLIAPGGIIMGFKLLSNVSKEALLDVAHRLLVKNRCDFVFANDASEITGDRHHGYLLNEAGVVETYETKQAIAEGIAKIMMDEVGKR